MFLDTVQKNRFITLVTTLSQVIFQCGLLEGLQRLHDQRKTQG